jgi:hypothetical protein
MLASKGSLKPLLETIKNLLLGQAMLHLHTTLRTVTERAPHEYSEHLATARPEVRTAQRCHEQAALAHLHPATLLPAATAYIAQVKARAAP